MSARMEAIEALRATFLATGELPFLQSAISLTFSILANTPPAYQLSLVHLLTSLVTLCYDTTGLASDLLNAIQVLEGTIAATPIEDPRRAGIQHNLGVYLAVSYTRTGNIADITKAVQAGEEAVAATPEGHPSRALMCTGLATSLAHTCDLPGARGLADADRMIWASEAAVTATPSDHPLRGVLLNNLGGYLSRRFLRVRNLADIDRAIEVGKAALATTPGGHWKRPARLDNVSTYLSHRFDRTDDTGDLTAAIEAREEWSVTIPQADPSWAVGLRKLAGLLNCRFDRFGAPDDLDNTIRTIEQIVVATPPGHLERVKQLFNLSILRSVRLERLGEMSDLDAAILAGEQATAETSITHAPRADILNNLSNLYIKRFDRLGALEDVQKAVVASETALEILHEALAIPAFSDTHMRQTILDQLSIAYLRRFNRLSGMGDLDAALTASQQAAAASADHPKRANILSQLGTCLHDRYQALQQLSDLHASISITETAIAAMDNSIGRAEAESNLSFSIAQRFERLGDPADIDRAIQTSAAALAAFPQDHPRRPGVLVNIAHQLFSRFFHLGTREDLEGAIEASRESLDATTDDHPDRGIRLFRRACWLAARFLRVPELRDLDMAIQLTVAAVAVTRPDDPARAGMMGKLGYFWLLRFSAREGHEDALKDIDIAVEAAVEAVAAIPIHHISRPGKLNILGLVYLTRFKAVFVLSDLERAVRACEEAVETTPEDHPDQAMMLLLLARTLQCRQEAIMPILGRNGDFDRALETALKAWNCDTAAPRFRINAARLAGTLLSTSSRWAEVSSILGAAVKLLPSVSPPILRREDQEYILSEFEQLASGAVSAALQAGETAAHCLSLLELGRGIIMGFAIDCRSDLSELKRTNLPVWTSFSELRAEIDSPLTGPDETKRRRRVQAVQELNNTLCAIRRLPGLERFQLPPSAAELIAIAAGGSTIVVLNSTSLRSDALIVTSSEITALSLPKMFYAEVTQRMTELPRLVRGKRSTYAARNRILSQTLLWLWEVAVGPVCEHLGLAPTDSVRLPRLTWIGVGPLANAPFHAAGDHTRGSTNNTLSRAVSSYIATIKALSYARQKDLDLGTDSGLLLITMSTTPDTPATRSTPAKKWSALSSAAKEADDIAAVVAHTTRFDSPTTAAVLAALPNYQVIHFACHGVSDSVQPSSSYLLLLASDADDPATSKITVKDVAGMTAQTAQVAYLSACSTADNAAVWLADEVIHIATGFQLAGFGHVLATLWQGGDECCRRVAAEFYRLLFSGGVDGGSGKGGHGVVSQAFHGAVVALRDEYREQPVKWASFIHTGA